VYAGATAVVVAFQLALAAGAPWGGRAMGGRYSGRLPPKARAAAGIQAALLSALALVVLDGAGVLALGWTATHPWLAWVPVVVAGISSAANAATGSRAERRTWLPFAVVLLLSSLVVAAG
jgi:hypothetical protein